MQFLSHDLDLHFLTTEFDETDFKLFVSNDEMSYISCVACWCKTASQVIQNWNAIQNILSVHYQPPGDLARWNIYLAFFCTENLPLWEKYQIENDKYAVRKLVLDGMTVLPSEADSLVLLNNHILGADLQLTKNISKEADLPLTLSNYFRGIPLDSRAESRYERAVRINRLIELLSKDEN